MSDYPDTAAGAALAADAITATVIAAHALIRGVLTDPTRADAQAQVTECAADRAWLHLTNLREAPPTAADMATALARALPPDLTHLMYPRFTSPPPTRVLAPAPAPDAVSERPRRTFPVLAATAAAGLAGGFAAGWALGWRAAWS